MVEFSGRPETISLVRSPQTQKHVFRPNQVLHLTVDIGLLHQVLGMPQPGASSQPVWLCFSPPSWRTHSQAMLRTSRPKRLRRKPIRNCRGVRELARSSLWSASTSLSRWAPESPIRWRGPPSPSFSRINSASTRLPNTQTLNINLDLELTQTLSRLNSLSREALAQPHSGLVARMSCPTHFGMRRVTDRVR